MRLFFVYLNSWTQTEFYNNSDIAGSHSDAGLAELTMAYEFK